MKTRHEALKIALGKLMQAKEPNAKEKIRQYIVSNFAQQEIFNALYK